MKHFSMKILALLLTAVMLFGLLPAGASATEATELPEESVTIRSTDAPATRAADEICSYRLVTSDKYLSSGEYLIVAAATQQYAGKYNHYVLTTKEDGSYVIMQGMGQSFETLPMMINVASTYRTQYAWTVQGNANAMSIQDPAGSYLTGTSNTSELSLSKSATQWKAEYSANTKTFRISVGNRYLALRDDVQVKGDNGMCGFSTVPSNAAGDMELYVYKRVNTTDLKELTLYHSLNLASDITLNYVISRQELAGFEGLRIEITKPVYEGNVLLRSELYTLEPTVSGDYYYFVLEGMTAVQMNDVLQAVVYASKEGVDYVTETDYYSIGTYAYNQLAKEDATDTLRRVCAELLRYGSKSQVYKEYRTDALVDGYMTDAQKAYLSDLDGVSFGSCNTVLKDLENATVTWAGKSLDLQSKISVRFVLNLSNYTGKREDLNLRVSYVDPDGEEVTHVLRNCKVYNGEKSQYAFDFDGLRAAELRTVLSVAAYEGDNRVSATLQYSVDTYGNGKTGTLLEACQALMAYSDAALRYFVS